jgi:hypothetical protein
MPEVPCKGHHAVAWFKCYKLDRSADEDETVFYECQVRCCCHSRARLVKVVWIRFDLFAQFFDALGNKIAHISGAKTTAGRGVCRCRLGYERCSSP